MKIEQGWRFTMIELKLVILEEHDIIENPADEDGFSLKGGSSHRPVWEASYVLLHKGNTCKVIKDRFKSPFSTNIEIGLPS